MDSKKKKVEREIEIRIPLEKKDFNKFKKELSKITKLKKKHREIDEYFNPPHRNFLKPKYPFEWLRVGKRGEKVIFTYKHYYPEDAREHIYCDEYETEIKDFESFRKTLLSLNFRPLVIVDKEREIYFYKSKFKITLDKVRELGYFIEIESLKNLRRHEESKNKVLDFAKKLGLGPFKRDERGYPYLILKKIGRVR